MKKYEYLNRIRVENPCKADWNEMAGNDEVRFCSHCAKSVNDLSTITRKKALKLVRRSRGGICVRYIADPRTSGPVFSDDLVQIARRAPRVAAGVMSASLSLAALGYAQVPPPEEPTAAARQIAEESRPDDEHAKRTNDDAGGAASVRGTVTDSAGAVVPDARIVVFDENDREVKTGASNDEGVYSLENLPPGSFKMTVTSPGFRPQQLVNVALTGGASRTFDVTLEVGQIMGGAMIVSRREYKGSIARAVSDGDLDAVRDLISGGASVNEREDDKTTPLHIAVEDGNVEIVRLLIDFGAKMNARDEEKRTPLMLIDGDATLELVDLLLRGGARINVTAEDGTTPLMSAASGASAEVMQRLIDAGAEINARNEDGDTPLMLAAASDDLESVRTLLNAGAEVNTKNDADETALDHASNDDVIDLLKSFGATGKPKDYEEPAVADDNQPAESEPPA